MLNFIKSFIPNGKKSSDEVERKPAEIKIVCKDFDNLTSKVILGERDITGIHTYIMCPLCKSNFIMPNTAILKDSELHNEGHSVILLSGEIKPFRIS